MTGAFDPLGLTLRVGVKLLISWYPPVTQPQASQRVFFNEFNWGPEITEEQIASSDPSLFEHCPADDFTPAEQQEWDWHQDWVSMRAHLLVW